VVPLRTLTAGNGARAHGARAKAGTQYFFLSFFHDCVDAAVSDCVGVPGQLALPTLVITYVSLLIDNNLPQLLHWCC
jgi:hypothetical protein